jgi:transmembrane sensor
MQDELLFRVLKGRATDAEQRLVEAWRSESASNEERFRELAALLTLIVAHRRSGRGEAPPLAASLILSSQPSADTSDAVPLGRRARGRALRRLGAAAALILVGFGLSRLASDGREHSALVMPIAGEIVASANETATIRLPDGTIVRLAPETRLRVGDWSDARRVSLEGQAFFAVAHDEQRPFRIETEAGTVRVLGTRFNVETAHSDLRVFVVDGKVSLSTSTGDSATVVGGQVGRIQNGKEFRVGPARDHAYAEWLQGFLVFQNTPLRQVALEVEQSYGAEVRILTEELGAETVTAWFVDRDLEQVVSAICLAVDARCRVEAGVVTIE